MIIRFLIFLNIAFCYYQKDPIMMGLAGSYNTVAHGYQSVGINPANLAFEDKNYIGLFGNNMSLSNNLFTQYRLNDISGAYLDSTKKQDIIEYLDDGPIKVNSLLSLPFALNFSAKTIAITSKINTFSSFDLSQDFLKLFLYGNNQIGEDYRYNLSMNNKITMILETSFSKAFNFDPLGIGFTIKYLRGLFHYSLEPTQEPYFQTNFTDITSKNTYIMKQNVGGEGFAIDLGLATKRLESGWKFGISLINLGGQIKWNKLNSNINLAYDENESYLIDLSISEMNAQNLNSLPTDEIFVFDSFTVYEVNTLPDNININDIDSTYYCSDEQCNSYYVKSEDYDPDNLDLVSISSIQTEYPTSLSFGFSKKTNKGKIIVMDLVTGMDKAWGNLPKWRFSSGYIFGSKKIPVRIGFSYGGYDYKSVGFSYGFKGKKERFNIDFGFSYIDSFNIPKSNGFNFGINVYWINKK